MQQVLRHSVCSRGAVLSRNIQITSRNHAATLFKLPAISPTVTAWNIKEWKIKEGQCYSAGDVLLEIENNKIPVEVKAQDNGTLASIWKNDGSQNIQVGEVIGVLAENGDDIPSLEILEKGKSSSRESRSIEKPLFSQSDPTENISEPPNPVLSKPRADNAFVHSPAVMHLLREYSITDPSRIIATGPNGRILKGDVLAHIGKINESTPKSLTDAFCKLSKLDLRNIKAVEPNLIKSTVTREKAEGTRNDTNKTAFEKSILKIIDVEIDLSKVEKLAEKISEQLSTTVPACDLIYKAAKRAYQRNHRIQTRRPNRTDELFEDLVSNPSKTRGHTNIPAQFLRENSQYSHETCFAVVPLDFSSTIESTQLRLTESDNLVSTRFLNIPRPRYDIIDILSGKQDHLKIQKQPHELGQRIMKAQLVFDETKIYPSVALEYLNDIKMIIEQPGSLIN